MLLFFLTACDDQVLAPCGELTPDWAGVSCTLDQHCISCHADVHADPPVKYTILPEDLLFDLAHGTGKLVVPGDPDASLLWRSVSGELQVTDGWGIMPWGSFRPLPEDQTAHIREWIEAGAPVEDGL